MLEIAVIKTVDLPQYLRRIGFTGACTASAATLERLVYLHSHAIPFENLDSLAGERVSIGLDVLQDKMLARGRGGYCFEHNVLLWSVLSQLGFTVAGLAARVRWNAPEGVVRPIGHMALRVEAERQLYLVDAGFGGLTPTSPLRLDCSEPQATALEPFRIDGEMHGVRVLSVLLDGSWRPLYEYQPTEYQPGDYEAWNFWTCAAPESPFVTHLMAARPAKAGRHALEDNRYTFRPLGGAVHRRLLGSVAELRGIFASEFGISVPVSERLDARLATLIELS